MKKKKKGFTLVELLATITILGILLGIAIPSVMGYMNRGKDTYYHSLEDSVLNSARDYLIDYRSLYPREIGNTASISGDELLNNKYITNINDEDGKKCDATVIVEKIDKDEYDYHVCLKCGDNYSSSDESCDMIGNSGTTRNYVIEVEEFPTEVRQGDDLILPKGKVYAVENGVRTLITDKLDPTPKTIDTTVLGTTNVRWIYRYKSTNPKSVKVVDKVAPERPTVKLWFADGTEYKPNNSNGNVNITTKSIIMEITSRDYACVLGTTCRSRYPDLEGSGVKELRYRGEDDATDRIIPTTKATTRYTENESLWGNVTLKAVDNSNNVSDETSFKIYLDNEAPSKTTVTYLGGSNTHSWKNNYKLKLSATDNVEVAYYEIYIDGSYYGTTDSEWTPPNNFNNCQTTFRAVDLAGNKGPFSDGQHIHMDTEAPSVPNVKYNGGSNTCSWKNNYNLTLSSTDNVGVDHYEMDTNGDGKSDRTISSNFIPENNFSSCTVRFRAVDAAGNRSAWTGNHHIHMDTQKPSVPSVTYNGGSNSCSWKNNYNLTLTSTDNVSIAYYESDGNGDGIADFTTASNFIPWNGFSSCTQRFRAVDVAGNVSDWTGNHHIHMDTENPVHNNWWWGEVTKDVARLYIQVSDNASGINRIQCPTSTQSGGYNNWYWYNAVWDGGANAYRCDITPSTFGHYNQTYQTHLYVYDNAGNGGYYNQTSVTIPPQGYPISQVARPGDYVIYRPSSASYVSPRSLNGYGDQTIVPSNYTGSWRILYNNSSYGVQIISDQITTNITVHGYTGINNIYDTLNGISRAYMDGRYAISARHVGTNPSSPADPSGWCDFHGAQVKCWERTVYTTDLNGMNAATSQSSAGITRTNNEYFLISRQKYHGSNGDGSYCVTDSRTVTSSGEADRCPVSYGASSNRNYEHTITDGVRPVITLNGGTLVTGSGTAGNPWVIVY